MSLFIRLTQALDRAPVLLTLTMLFWAGNMTIGRAVRDLIPPVTLSFWRWTIAFLIAVIIGWSGFKRDWPMVRRHWPILAFFGLMGIAAYNTLFYTGLQYAPVTHGVLINANSPLVILLLGGAVFGDKVAPAAWIGVGLALTGVACVALKPGDVESLRFGVGEAWMVAGMLVYACYTVTLRKRPVIAPLTFIIVTFGLGVAALTPLYLLEAAKVGPPSLEPAALAAFAYTGTFPSLIAYLCFNRGVELAGSARASAYFYLQPIFGTLLGVIFLNEIFTARHALGFALVATGLLIAGRSRRKPA